MAGWVPTTDPAGTRYLWSSLPKTPRAFGTPSWSWRKVLGLKRLWPPITTRLNKKTLRCGDACHLHYQVGAFQRYELETVAPSSLATVRPRSLVLPTETLEKGAFTSHRWLQRTARPLKLTVSNDGTFKGSGSSSTVPVVDTVQGYPKFQGTTRAFREFVSTNFEGSHFNCRSIRWEIFPRWQ